MESILALLNHLIPVFYAAAWLNYSVYFVRDDPFAKRTATPFLAFTAALHILYVILVAVAYRHHPMASVFEVLSVIALALTLVYMAVEIRQKNKSTGVFILPVVFLLQLASSVWIAPTPTIDPMLSDSFFGLHTGSVTLAYAAFFPLPSVAYDDPVAFEEMPVGNGPFRMEGPWEHDVVVPLIRYEDYAGPDPASVERLQFTIIDDLNTAYNEVLAGNLDILGPSLPTDQIATAPDQFGDNYGISSSTSARSQPMSRSPSRATTVCTAQSSMPSTSSRIAAWVSAT